MKASRIRKWLTGILIILVIGASAAFLGYRAIFSSPLNLAKNEGNHIYLYQDISADSLRSLLISLQWMEKPKAWDLTARLTGFNGKIPAGHYMIDGNLSALALQRKFGAGWQDPVRLSFHGVRLKEDLAGRIAPQLRLDSAAITSALYDDGFLAKWGLSAKTATSIFIPNTYEVYWTMNEEELMARMKKEYDAFWNSQRKEKASQIGLTALEVTILASIVQEETNKTDEMSRVAGVYINRLNRGMKLQADPTARFATQNFGIRRVLNSDLEVVSPYNTYHITGLPPGPITIPEPSVLDAVLNYESHDYLFMCAKADKSGYHAFARTNAQHEANAAAYRRSLDREGIYR